jgi:hypothetical protein
MDLDPEALGAAGVEEEVARHSRMLARREELDG